MNVFGPLSKQPRLALIATAVAVLLAGNAQPQDSNRQNANPPSQSTQVARSDTGMQTLEQYLQNKTLRVSKLVGMEVQSRSGDNLGEVHDVARNAAPGQNMQLIVALGGIVGDDQKLIAIPFDGIQISADGDELHTNRTRDQLAGLARGNARCTDRESRSRTAQRRRRVALSRTREPRSTARPARHRCASDASAISWESRSSAAAATRSAKSTTSYCRRRVPTAFARCSKWAA